MKANTTLITALLALPLTLACSSLGYRDPGEEETVNIDWGSTDLQTFAAGMVESLHQSPNLSYIDKPGDDNRIVLAMGSFANMTTDHIDLTALRDKMKPPIVERARFRIVATDVGQDELAKQVRFQQDSGRVDVSQAKAFGHQLGADVVLFGSLRDITKKTGRSIESGGTKVKDVYYQLVLEAVNVETGELVWANEEEIRKRQVIGLFGR